MSEENKKNILYTPDITYDKNYESSGRIIEEFEEIKKSEEDLISNLLNNIKNIEAVLPLLPKDLSNMVKPILNVINKIIPEVDNSDIATPPSDDNNSYVYPNYEPDKIPELVYPSTFFRKEPDPFVIETYTKPKPEIIMDNYNYDLVSIIEDYINKLHEKIMNYFNNIMSLLSSISADSYTKVLEDYIVETDKINKDYKHLSDLIIRNQITRKMKSRMYNKLFNLDKTIIQIKACKVCVEQRIRYYEAEYQDDNELNNVVSNRLLEKSRMQYDVKYKQNFTNLYKYLNSSVVFFDECLCMHINEIQAKTILLEKEGNDLW